MRSPIVWMGGKGRMVKKILPAIEAIPHKFYVEPFGGGASLLLAKEPVSVETYNDIDSNLYQFFMTLADSELFKRFYEVVSWYPYSRELYNDSLATYQDEPDPIIRVAKWYVIARQSFGGRFGSGWGSSVTETSRNMPITTSKWMSTLDLLPEIHARLQRVQIENKDGINLIQQHDRPDTLFYVDPPYVMSTRKSGKYLHEVTDEYHEQLLEVLVNLKGSAVVSGYPHPMYDKLDAHGFVRTEFETTSHLAGRVRNSTLQGKGNVKKNAKRTEVMWVKDNSQ